MLEDRLLIWKFNRGDRGVLHRIYEKYKDNLVGLAAALLFDVSSAEDVVHDVFVSFISDSERFRLTGSLRGFLATCVANKARNKNKALHRHQGIDFSQTEVLASNSDGPVDNAIFGEELAEVSRSLRQLPYEQREVLILHICSGMKFRTIAELQGVSTNTAQGRFRYALDKLRSLLYGQVTKYDEK
jgi:RNA polymerase sigma-70 factor (ECF subfamily)